MNVIEFDKIMPFRSLRLHKMAHQPQNATIYYFIIITITNQQYKY